MVPWQLSLLGIIFFVFSEGDIMIDMHYDLLSILYYCYLRNDFRYVEELKQYFNENNVNGLIANLYFMSAEEMAQEMNGHIVDVIEMFKISTNLFKKFFPNIDVLYSIEGCDFINNVDELKKLRKLGLGSILLVWNNKNKYGSGSKAKGGLSEEGKAFIKEAVNLGLVIDLSHMNKETFIDTINVLKKIKREGINPKVIVSHSDVYNLFNHPRNITDEQIGMLKEFNPIVGLVSYSLFLTDQDNESLDTLKKKYLNHINHVVKILGIESVGVSTDDMGYNKILLNKKMERIIFPYASLKADLYQLLSLEYNEEEVKKILEFNVKNKLFKEE